ncbi:MAG: two-component sensor histidine kinase [Actinobacteria bacterium]|jgi:two-component system sensor histidine kinase SenX3|nr:two-component sensor histidine kinase [Actinomycetota bacterium]MBT3688376.1 two-component sensor histidine kinase [Actinomycetota bacterium]MBT4037274.1 two-component sensor histidine kinase [Actinomycetota bacterium]MBT4278726.1 two-component sensor histidine kinase [Actinomycetota bacterium]MBT4343946.1 two-component sensor histidine kinase [Actinomycetota bacterium]
MLLTVAFALVALGLGFLLGRRGDRRNPDPSAGTDTTVAPTGLGDSHEGRVLDVIPLGIVVADENGGIVYRNTTADALVDTWVDGVVGRLVAERLVAAAAGESSSEQVRTPGSSSHILQVVARPLQSDDSGAGVVGAVAILEDITERSRQESVRRDFVANVSHELKTPIGALSLLAETLVAETDPDVVGRLSARIETESQRVGSIIEDLLDLSRIEGESPDRVELLDLAGLAAQVVERVLPIAEQRGISIRVEANSGVHIEASRNQMVSMMRNLVENAVKYSDDGGKVAVSLRSDDGGVRFEVADDGIGVPERDIERVFERFYRVDRARTRETGGTGLGLSIVRNVVLAHGGQVDLSSTEGNGTTVLVRLPTAAAVA